MVLVYLCMAKSRLVALLAVSLVASGLMVAGGPGNVVAAAVVAPSIDIDLTADERGLWVTRSDGSVEAFGAAVHHGDTPPLAEGERVTALAGNPVGDGYWLFTNRGNAFAFGSAVDHGDIGHLALVGEVIAAVSTSDGLGYYMLGADGGIFALGSAVFLGSIPQLLPGVALDGPVVGMSVTPGGYVLVAEDGGTFAFGAARFYGSIPQIAPTVQLSAPVVGLVPGSAGYLMVAADGGIFNFGKSLFHGSLAGIATSDVVAVAVKADLSGYLILDSGGTVWAMGATRDIGVPSHSGMGDGSVDETVAVPVIIRFRHEGVGAFSVLAKNAGGDAVGNGASGVGAHDGYVLLEAMGVESFQIAASGRWTLDILPLSYARHWRSSTGPISGVGPEVIRVAAQSEGYDLLVDTGGSGQVIVAMRPIADDTASKVLVDAVGPVTRKVGVPGSATAIVSIDTVGSWTLDTKPRNPSGGSVVMGLESEAGGLRPWEDSCAAGCLAMMSAVFDTLVELDSGGRPVPNLAKSIAPSADFTIWDVTLRAGVRFHDGTPLTSDTLVDMFAVQQGGSVSIGWASNAGLESVETTGPLSVRYRLSRSNSAFPSFLAEPPLGMVFQPAAAADSRLFRSSPIGTGPFKVVSRDVGEFTLMDRNDHYWRMDAHGVALPYLDSIEFRPIPDEGTRVSTLAAGLIDLMHTFANGSIRDLRDLSGQLGVYEHTANNATGGLFNSQRVPTDDVRVRRGLVMLIDQEAINTAFGGDNVTPIATQRSSPDSPWYSSTAASAYPMLDIAGGTALLAEYVNDPSRSDGKPVGSPIEIELSCPPDPALIAEMQIIEAVWTSTGMINVVLTQFDMATHINHALGVNNGFIGLHQAACWPFFFSLDDPSRGLEAQFGAPTVALAQAAGAPFSAVNFTDYWDPELHRWIVETRLTDDFQTRYDLLEKIMIRLAEQTPAWLVSHTQSAIGANQDLLGFGDWHTPDGALGIGHPNAEIRWHELRWG